MRAVFTLLIVAFATSALFGDEVPTLGPEVYQTIRSKDGKVMLELRGRVLPTQAWVISAAGKRRFVALSETSIIGAEVSEDGRYIALSYHISSGGYGATFVRLPDGGYRELVDNLYAFEQIKKGHVPGLRLRDIPELPRRSIHCGIFLAHSPDRLIFPISGVSIGHEVELTYSLEQRRIIGWERLLLECSLFDEAWSFSLSLRELSAKRGMALVAHVTQKSGEEDETLIVTFPTQKFNPQQDKELHLKRVFGKDEFVALNARRLPKGSNNESARWQAEITGSGEQYRSLLAKLSSYRKSRSPGADVATDWPAPEKFRLSTP